MACPALKHFCLDAFSSKDLRNVNAIPTKEKQQKVFQNLKLFYDPSY